MGDPKKSRKRYSRPKSPWRSDQLAQELYLLGIYGLRNKRELWRAQSQLSSTRKQARTLLAATQQVRLRDEKKFMDSLVRKGLVKPGSPLDDVLSLTVEDVLARRLQSMIFKRGMAVSPLQARQAIVHGHVVIGQRRGPKPQFPPPPGEGGEGKILWGPAPPPPHGAGPPQAGVSAGAGRA